ncbi:hypothetical protein [Oleispirillum naphthae]|uniref:hypothetical protein n=1 Tax=Oleispirillum naphthae TaxID=2838853 RepID=UPI0030825A94
MSRGRIVAPSGRIGRIRPLPGRGGPRTPRPAAPQGAEEAQGGAKTLILFVALPMFLQSFHYMVDAGPLYYLSKAWPVLAFPLALLCLRGRLTAAQGVYGLTLVYVAGVTPALSMIHFGNSVFDALATTAKVWPLTYFFSALGGLLLLKPGEERLRRVVLALGIATFAVMWALWLIVPKSFYASSSAVTKLFLFDYERGYRIYMPMTFGLILMFFSARRALSSLSAWAWWVPVGFGLISLLVIYKQRTTIAAALVVVGLIALRSLPRRFILGLVGVGGTLALLAALTVLLGGDGGWTETLIGSLGASLSVRQETAATASRYLLVSPLSWIFGVGSITRFSSMTLNDVFGSDLFFLADIGWLGVVFEYGAVGAVLILMIHAVGLRRALRRAPVRAGTPAGDFRRALGDMIIMVCLETAIYSPVFTPGIVAALTASLIYLDAEFSAHGTGKG